MSSLSDAARELGKWPRDLYVEAVWASPALTTPQLAVALAFADHAGPSDPPAAWVGSDRLQARTKLKRTAAATTVRALVRLGWLTPTAPPRKGFTATYLLTVPDEKAASRPSEKAVSRPSPETEGRLATGEGRLATREGRQATPTSLPTSPLTTTPREGAAVIVQPEDREPASAASLADRLRGLGVTWPERDVRAAHARLYALLGSDVRAEGQANGVLTELAKRRRPVQHLTSWLSRLDDDAVLALPEVTSLPGRSKSTERPARIPTPGEAADIERRRQSLDQHPHGQAARAEARRSIGDVPAPPTDARVDREAELLLRDPSWIAEQQERAA
jgi:hypothetical protein